MSGFDALWKPFEDSSGVRSPFAPVGSSLDNKVDPATPSKSHGQVLKASLHASAKGTVMPLTAPAGAIAAASTTLLSTTVNAKPSPMVGSSHLWEQAIETIRDLDEIDCNISNNSGDKENDILGLDAMKASNKHNAPHHPALESPRESKYQPRYSEMLQIFGDFVSCETKTEGANDVQSPGSPSGSCSATGDQPDNGGSGDFTESVCAVESVSSQRTRSPDQISKIRFSELDLQDNLDHGTSRKSSFVSHVSRPDGDMTQVSSLLSGSPLPSRHMSQSAISPSPAVASPNEAKEHPATPSASSNAVTVSYSRAKSTQLFQTPMALAQARDANPKPNTLLSPDSILKSPTTTQSASRGIEKVFEIAERLPFASPSRQQEAAPSTTVAQTRQGVGATPKLTPMSPALATLSSIASSLVFNVPPPSELCRPSPSVRARNLGTRVSVGESHVTATPTTSEPSTSTAQDAPPATPGEHVAALLQRAGDAVSGIVGGVVHEIVEDVVGDVVDPLKNGIKAVAKGMGLEVSATPWSDQSISDESGLRIGSDSCFQSSGANPVSTENSNLTSSDPTLLSPTTNPFLYLQPQLLFGSASFYTIRAFRILRAIRFTLKVTHNIRTVLSRAVSLSPYLCYNSKTKGPALLRGARARLRAQLIIPMLRSYTGSAKVLLKLYHALSQSVAALVAAAPQFFQAISRAPLLAISLESATTLVARILSSTRTRLAIACVMACIVAKAINLPSLIDKASALSSDDIPPYAEREPICGPEPGKKEPKTCKTRKREDTFRLRLQGFAGAGIVGMSLLIVKFLMDKVVFRSLYQMIREQRIAHRLATSPEAFCLGTLSIEDSSVPASVDQLVMHQSIPKGLDHTPRCFAEYASQPTTQAAIAASRASASFIMGILRSVLSCGMLSMRAAWRVSTLLITLARIPLRFAINNPRLTLALYAILRIIQVRFPDQIAHLQQATETKWRQLTVMLRLVADRVQSTLKEERDRIAHAIHGFHRTWVRPPVQAVRKTFLYADVALKAANVAVTHLNECDTTVALDPEAHVETLAVKVAESAVKNASSTMLLATQTRAAEDNLSTTPAGAGALVEASAQLGIQSPEQTMPPTASPGAGAFESAVVALSRTSIALKDGSLSPTEAASTIASITASMLQMQVQMQLQLQAQMQAQMQMQLQILQMLSKDGTTQGGAAPLEAGLIQPSNCDEASEFGAINSGKQSAIPEALGGIVPAASDPLPSRRASMLESNGQVRSQEESKTYRRYSISEITPFFSGLPPYTQRDVDTISFAMQANAVAAAANREVARRISRRISMHSRCSSSSGVSLELIEEDQDEDKVTSHEVHALTETIPCSTHSDEEQAPSVVMESSVCQEANSTENGSQDLSNIIDVVGIGRPSHRVSPREKTSVCDDWMLYEDLEELCNVDVLYDEPDAIEISGANDNVSAAEVECLDEARETETFKHSARAAPLDSDIHPSFRETLEAAGIDVHRLSFMPRQTNGEQQLRPENEDHKTADAQYWR